MTVIGMISIPDFFVRQMGRLRQAGMPVILLYDNHDAESEMTKRLV